MVSEKIIAVDVDDVVCDLIGEWLKKYNKLSGDSLKPTDIHSWEIGEYVKPGWQQKLFQLLREPDFYETVKPYAGAKVAINRLREFGRVVFLTSCVADTMDQKLRWLCHNGFLPPNRASHDFIACKDKWMVGADVLIDDHVVNVETFSGKALLVSRPHNMKLSCSRPRISDLSEATERLKLWGFKLL